jgi:ribosome-associated toxin RatA of RatAB toxin-antitoxin module
MAEQATEHMTIAVPPSRCYEVALDIEAYPEWARDIKEADVVERDEQDRPRRVAFRAAAMGHSARYTLRYDHEGAPDRIAWVLEEGDVVRRLDGEYLFAAVDGDPDATAVTYHLVVELAVPLPGFVKRRAEGKIMTTALDELKRRCEGDPPPPDPDDP